MERENATRPCMFSQRARARVGRLSACKLTMTLLCAGLSLLAFAGAPATAEISHKYLSQISGFSEPFAVAVDGAGRVYVADRAANTVDRFDSNGAPLPFSASASYVEGSKLTGTPSGGFQREFVRGINGIAVDDESGNIYVADGPAHVVDVYSSTGQYLSRLTGTSPSEPFSEPEGLDVDQATHDLYVVDRGNGISTVDVFASTGAYQSQFGNGLLNGVDGTVAVNELTKDSYVGRSSLGIVYVFDPFGNQIPPEWLGASTPDGSFGSGYLNQSSVGLDPSTQHVFVANIDPSALHPEVDEFGASTTEEYLGQLTGTPSGPFVAPHAVTGAVGSGNLYVADQKVIDIFGPDIVVPTTTVQAPSSVGQAVASVSGSVNPSGVQVTSCEFEYGTSTAYGQSAPCEQTPVQIGAGNAPVTVTATLSGLQPNTVYHYRLKAVNANAPNASRDEVLTTTGPPTIQSESAEVKETEKAGQTSASLNAQIIPGGRETTYQFEYGETTSYGTSTPIPAAAIGNGEEAVTLATELTGLKVGTTYHYRVTAGNEYGTTNGADQQFTTVAAALIDVSATDVGATSATFDAEIDPLGNDTTAYFQYGTEDCTTSPAVCTDVPLAPGTDLGSAENDQPLTVHVQGLTAGTVYHFRVLAINSLGTVEAPDLTFVTEAIGTGFALPDGRAWELVSPPDKHGAGFAGVGEEQGAVIQAAAGGGAMTYSATSPIVSNPAGSRSLESTQVFSTRMAPGVWDSQDIATVHTEGSGVAPVGEQSEYKLFSSDLTLGLVQPVGETPLPPLPAGSENTDYLRSIDGEYSALVTSANVPAGTKFGGEIKFAGASPDLGHVVISSNVVLTSGGIRQGPFSDGSRLYEWVAGVLQPVSVLPDGEEVRGEIGDHNYVLRHAVSDDGSRIVWGFDTGPHFLRDMTRKETVRVDAPEEGLVEGNGQTDFQTASSNGSRMFFTRSQESLTRNTTASTGLYVFEVTSGKREPLAGRLTSLTEAGKVLGVIGASEDGSYVYFVDSGVLGDGVVRGAERGGDNLYVEHYDEASRAWAQPTFIAGLSSEDAHSWGSGIGASGVLREMTSRVSPDGRYVMFMSERSLTGYDNRDANSGALDEEVFLYDASSSRLVCGSCDPTGARPVGMLESGEYPGPLVDHARNWKNRWLAGNIPGWTNTGGDRSVYQSRYLADGGRLFFNSTDALVPADVNGVEDVYEYEPVGVGSCEGSGHGGSAGEVFSQSAGGCVALVSSGKSSEESAFMDASVGGGDVFFLTGSRLSPLDYDTGVDLYDAHVCTSVEPCPPDAALIPPPCTTGDACKAAPTPQPAGFGAPSSQTFSGAGNVTASGSVVAVRSKGLTRAQKLARALRACAKRPKRKRGACQRNARKRYGASVSRARKGSSRGTSGGRS